MIKQALNAATIAEVMRRFAKDDAVKLLGKSTYNKWLKKLPADRIASNTAGRQVANTSEGVQTIWNSLRAREADRLRRAQDVSNDLTDHYGPNFEANLPRVNDRLDTQGRLKGAVLKEMSRRNFLREFADRNSLVSRDELLRWNRRFNAGLDPKTLTSEWYVKPTALWTEDAAAVLRNPRPKPSKIYYNRKEIPEDTTYRNAQTVRNMAAVPYTDHIRHTAARLVANELDMATFLAAHRKSIYNSVSDNTRKVLNYVAGRNILEDPVAARLVEAADNHRRLDNSLRLFRDGNYPKFDPALNAVIAHPWLPQDVKNHEWAHYLLHNMDTQEHADTAGRVFRNIAAISRKNPEYSELAKKLIGRPREAHEAVTDYYRHKLYGTLGSRVDEAKAMGQLNTDLHRTEPVINHIVSETQNLTSNPSLQQALQQLALSYDVPLRNTEQIPDSVLELANLAMSQK